MNLFLYFFTVSLVIDSKSMKLTKPTPRQNVCKGDDPHLISYEIGEAQNLRLALYKLTESWPNWLHLLIQAFLDWLTGFYLSGPLWRSTPLLELVYGLCQFSGGFWLIIFVYALPITWWWLIPFGILLSVAGAAQLQEVAHFAAHDRFFIQENHNDQE